MIKRMCLDSIKHGLVFNGEEYLGSGILQEKNGAFELELLEPRRNDETFEEYGFGELLPESYQCLEDGGVAFGVPKYKPFPERLTMIIEVNGFGYLLLGCNVRHREPALVASGPVASRKNIEVRHIVVLPSSQLRLPKKGYNAITNSRVCCSELDAWLCGRNHALRFPDVKSRNDPFVRVDIYHDIPIKIGNIPWAPEPLTANILIHTDASGHTKPAVVIIKQKNYFEVRSNRQLSLEEHLRIQHSFIALVELGCSERIVSPQIEVSHLHDLVFLPGKKNKHRNWRQVLTHEFGTKVLLKRKSSGRGDLFAFPDIKAGGVTKWFKLLHDYPSAMYPFINLIENEDYLTVEVQILLCGVIIENLERVRSKKNASFSKYMDWVLDDLKEVVISHSRERANWTEGIADAYNGIKHVEHAQMSVQKKAELLYESKLVLKYWVAMSLGCDESIIKEHISTHRIELSEIDSIFPNS